MVRSTYSFGLAVLIMGQISLSAQTITRDEFLQQVRRGHPAIGKERLSADIERESQQGLLGREDWYLTSQAGFSHEQPAIAFSGPERTNTLSFSAGAERAVWSTGGRFSASFSTGAASILPTFGFSMPFYQNVAAVSYVHPLLKNSGGTLDRLSFDLKEYDVTAARVQADENIEAFLARSAQLFLTWVFLDEQEKIFAERLRLSQEERDRTLDKRRANLVDQADVIRAEDAVRSWKQQQVLVHSQWKAVQAQLAVLAGDERLYGMRPAFDLYAIPDLGPLDRVIERMRTRSRLLGLLDVRKRQLEHGRDGFEESLKPDLSVYAVLNTKRLHESIGTSFVMNKPDANIGVRFSIPLGNREARAQLAMTDVQLARMERERAEVALSLTSVLTNLHIRLDELRQVLALNQEQIESARQRTAEELKLYNQGRGNLTFVILGRDNEQNAQLTYAQNAFTYHSLRLEYAALLDEVYEGEVN